MLEKKTTICPICKNENPSDINFCKFCRYPINVKKINELNKEELSVCLANFLEVITKQEKPLFENQETSRVYDELLSLHWLRPESTLFRFIESMILLNFKKKYLKYPLLDLGCGDGLFTAILFGARLNKVYDAYEAIDFSKNDIYNCYTKLPRDFFVVKPSPIGFGVDIKENAVKKAEDLGVYDKVKKGDVRELPFEKNSVNSVFSNMINDIKREDLDMVFKEAYRVLNPHGYFVFTTPTERFRDFLFYFNKAKDFKKQGDELKYELFSKLDRGRSEWEPSNRSFWTELAEKTSFELVEYIEYGNRNLFEFWDTGLRPFFYYLMNIRQSLKEKELLLLVKKIYLEMLRTWLFKFTEGQIMPKGGGAFAIIVAKKIPKISYEERK